ncbi:MAG: hypothetical protein HUJ58_06510 [Erysipelotrichaceae bacterium]|nr:hypothetical protein [Erysipelotrichaceae bacterium]
MFGYVVINKQELKFREYDEYRSFYCGLCSVLSETDGIKGQVALNYDMTFLHILLTGLYEPENTITEKHCILHPFAKQTKLTNDYTQYCADMTIVLSYFKCADDWNDEQKITRWAYKSLMEKRLEEIKKKYPAKISAIRKALDTCTKLEAENETNIDYLANCTGELMAEVFAYKNDEWEKTLRHMGFYLGKFIYLIDAYEDLFEDEKKERFNVLLPRYRMKKETFDDMVQSLLEQMLAECCDAFERLPVLQYQQLIRNILYSGVWTRYEMIRKKRNEG